MTLFIRVLGMLIGLLVMAGSVAAWHYWRIDGMMACLFAFGGCCLIETALLGKKDEAEEPDIQAEGGDEE